MRRVYAALAARREQQSFASMRRFFTASLAHLDRTHPATMARPVTWADLPF